MWCETRGEAGLGIIAGSGLRGNAGKRTSFRLQVGKRISRSEMSPPGEFLQKIGWAGRSAGLPAEEGIQRLQQRAVHLADAVPTPDVSQQIVGHHAA